MNMKNIKKFFVLARLYFYLSRLKFWSTHCADENKRMIADVTFRIASPVYNTLKFSWMPSA